MNVLLVDDQVNVLNGLTSGIDFCKIGFDGVYTASGVGEALKVLEALPIDVLVSDIEMPERNGMELNTIVREKYPDTLRILLTSHAIFAYAQEGLKLGCFDYLVQPVPYAKIEESLSRARARILQKKKHRQVQSLGSLFDSHRVQFLNNTMMDLFSKIPERRDESIPILREAGYHITDSSFVKMLLVDVLNFDFEAATADQVSEMIMSMKATIRKLDIPQNVEYIIGKTRYNQFVVLFFSLETFAFNTDLLETLYMKLEAVLGSRLACYVGWTAPISEIRVLTVRIHDNMQNNVSRKPGLIYVHMLAGPEHIPTSLDEFIVRWDGLLKAGQQGLLRQDIFSYLDRNLEGSSNQYLDLCMLHQRISQMFFTYFYEKKLDVASLFNENMRYDRFMQSYNSTDALKEAVDFLIAGAETGTVESPESSYVERAKTYILNNTDKLLTVKDVSRYISLNPEYFTRLFKRETGYNIKDYIIQCKVTVAKDLLINSNLPISMVALELGYGNFSHFTQMFRRAEGVTPKEYRVLHRKK